MIDKSLKKKLDIIEEKIDLGSFDSVFLACSIFISSIIISLSGNTGYISMLKSNQLQLIVYVLLLIFAIAIFILVAQYFLMLFQYKTKQFSLRFSIVLTFFAVLYFLISMLLLMLLLFILKCIFPNFFNMTLLSDKSLSIFSFIGVISEILIGATIFIFTRRGWPIYQQVLHFFKKNYPNLYSLATKKKT